jgi:hypothetical protein
MPALKPLARSGIAARNGLVFVLNAGVPNNVTGFRLNPQGATSLIEPPVAEGPHCAAVS